MNKLIHNFWKTGENWGKIKVPGENLFDIVFSRVLRDSIAHYVGRPVCRSVGGLAVSSYIYINEQMHIF